MTFGQTLKQMLSISGIKMGRFAEKLGYDISYVSRWVNDIKIPSQKNNNDLLRKITETIVNECDAKGTAQLEQFYCKNRPIGELQEAMTAALQAVYANPKDSQPLDQLTCLPEANVVYLPTSALRNLNEIFRNAFVQAALAKNFGLIEGIAVTPLGRFSNHDAGFFEGLKADSGLPPMPFLMHQLIDMEDFSENVDAYCAAICTYAYFSDAVSYKFYEYKVAEKRRGSYTMIENYLLYQTDFHPLTGFEYTYICRDREVLNPGWILSKLELNFLPLLLSDGIDEGEYLSRVFHASAMESKVQYLMNIMHPIYLSETLMAEFAKRYGFNPEDNNFKLYMNSKSRLPTKDSSEVVIFHSALLDYIYNGRIQIYDRVLNITLQDRIRHLRQLLQQDCCHLTIISDDNPLLNLKELRLSIYLSGNIGIMVALAEDKNTIIRLRSPRLVGYFNEFFKHLQQLGPEYCTTGEDAFSLIRHVLARIDPDAS